MALLTRSLGKEEKEEEGEEDHRMYRTGPISHL